MTTLPDLIMDPKKKVSDILKENSSDKALQVLDFVRYKVGKGFRVNEEFNGKIIHLRWIKAFNL